MTILPPCSATTPLLSSRVRVHLCAFFFTFLPLRNAGEFSVVFYTAFGPSGPSGLMMPKNRLDFHHESNASSLLILPPFWQSLGNRNPLLYFTALDTSLSQGMSASQFHCVDKVLRIEDRQHSLFNLRTLGIFDFFAFRSPISIKFDSILSIKLFLRISSRGILASPFQHADRPQYF